MEITASLAGKIKTRLEFIYKEAFSDELLQQLFFLIRDFPDTPVLSGPKWDEKDVVLITYGDSIIKEHEKPLETLNCFLNKNLENLVTCVHILPFFPYSSDDGFSIIDYKQVNPEFGSWEDILKITARFDLMTDLVINHASSKSEWFQNFLQGKHLGSDYFIALSPDTDLTGVVRPRSSPLLTPFETNEGVKHIWTTFSADQVDLNFANPRLMLEMIDILLWYVKHGARIIRLDAIAFLWKVPGTPCLHLPETHEFVKLMRDILEAVDPRVIVLTETNVPNKENLSYFGNNDEAHMVYQFSLPPLLLHALNTGNSYYLNKWAKELPNPAKGTTYFNFTASHDGIGVRPLEGLLPQDEFNRLIDSMKASGSLINTKRNSNGTDSPYEMNITYFDALKQTQNGQDDFQVERFLCSQTILLSLQGVPALYIHSLTATPNDYAGVKRTGHNRSINRRKYNAEELEELLTTNTPNASVFNELRRLIALRAQYTAFHPDSPQQIHEYGAAFFVIHRQSCINNEQIMIIANITGENQILKKEYIPGKLPKDLITGESLDSSVMELNPYQVRWVLYQVLG